MTPEPTSWHTDMVLVDIVGFSLLSDLDQYQSVLAISEGVRESLALVDRVPGTAAIYEELIPTGDGFFILLRREQVGLGPLVALSLRNYLLYRQRQMATPFAGVRVSAHHGTVMPFTDAAGKANFVGSGLNDCARLQSLPVLVARHGRRFAGDDNGVFISTVCWRRSQNSFDYRKLVKQGFRVSPEFDFQDKHGKPHQGVFVEINRTWIAGI